MALLVPPVVLIVLVLLRQRRMLTITRVAIALGTGAGVVIFVNSRTAGEAYSSSAFAGLLVGLIVGAVSVLLLWMNKRRGGRFPGGGPIRW